MTEKSQKVDFVKKLEQEARDYIWSGKQPAYLSRRAGVFILFKPNEDSLMKFAYVCPSCGHEEHGEQEFKKPYTLNCSSCGFEIFKQEKIKGARKKRKKKS